MSPTLLLANSLAPYVAWGIGSEASLSLPFSMLATTLAAMVERPFYKFSGIEVSSFRFSMKANILSWFVGLIIAYASIWSRIEFVFFLMYILAIPFSIAIEGAYLSRVSKAESQNQLKWTPVILGNVLSGLLLFAILVVGLEVGDRMQRGGSWLILFLTQHKEIIQWSVGVGCTFLFCFYCLPKKRNQLVAQTPELENEPQTEI